MNKNPTKIGFMEPLKLRGAGNGGDLNVKISYFFLYTGSYLGGGGFPSPGAIATGAVAGAAATLGAGVGAAAGGGACSAAGGVVSQTIVLITSQIVGVGMGTPP